MNNKYIGNQGNTRHTYGRRLGRNWKNLMEPKRDILEPRRDNCSHKTSCVLSELKRDTTCKYHKKCYIGLQAFIMKRK